MNKRILLTILTLASFLAVGCAPEKIVEQVEVTRIVEREVEVTRLAPGETVVETVVETVYQTVQVPVDPTVTFDGHIYMDIPSLDPQLAYDSMSVQFVENLFVQLTNYELETGKVIPEAASAWEISDDGLVYTFHLRDDIPWVKYNPRTRQVVQEMTAKGAPLFVTAKDFVYGIKRACDPNLDAYYSSIIAPLIKECSAVLFTDQPDEIPAELWDAIGVSAPDPTTLVIELEFPASYFLSMSTLWTLSAAPAWAIDLYGQSWTEMGRIVTSGRYTLAEWVHGVSSSALRNPMIPDDLAGTGNIERMAFTVIDDEVAAYEAWRDARVDTSRIPNEELSTHLESYSDETDQIPRLAVHYYGFRMTKPPVDDVHVRRALSAAFDREGYVRDVLQGQGLPMIHFAPPGIFGAPPIDQIGISFDPEYAREQMAAAGYPNCQGFPEVTMMAYSSPENLQGLEYARKSWSDVLGCDPELFKIEKAEFRELLTAIAAEMPDAKSPHMWTLGWTPDYADENNWVGDVLWCQISYNPYRRTCNEVDGLIVQAREEQEPAVRESLYRQIEEMLFGWQGEIPFMPLAVGTGYVARHAWLQRAPALFGGDQWYHWSIDWAAKTAARGG